MMLLKYVLVVCDHLPLVFVAPLLAVTGSDGGPCRAAAGVVDGINDRLPSCQGDLELNAIDLWAVELCYGLLSALHPLVSDEPAVLLNLHGDVYYLAVLGEGRPKKEICHQQRNRDNVRTDLRSSSLIP